MGALSFGHWVVVLLVVLIVLATGRFPRLMQDLGDGIKSFRGSVGEERSRVSIATNEKPEDSK